MLGSIRREIKMPSATRMTTKDGRVFYKIRCHIDRDRPALSMRWYVPEGWSQKAIERELAKVAADFERRCKAGEVLTRSEQKKKDEEDRAKAEQIKTVKEYAEKVYLPGVKITCSEATRSSYTYMLELHVFPALGSVKMPDVTPAQITALLLKHQKNMAHASVVKLYAVINLLFKSAYLDDTITVNPMWKVQRPKPRKDEKHKDGVAAFTAEEIAHILECLEREPLKWQVYVRLLIETGIRRGEGCGLQWDCVDLDNLTVTICRAAYYTKAAGCYVSTTKNGKSRTVSISPALADLMKRYRTEQAGKHLSKWVFTQEGTAECMFPQSPDRFFRTFSKDHGIDDFHPHKLRHSFASIAITNGADIASVSEILGHSDKAVTLRVYSHADDESKRRATQTFLDAITPKKAEAAGT